jgi:cell division protein FtsQ
MMATRTEPAGPPTAAPGAPAAGPATRRVHERLPHRRWPWALAAFLVLVLVGGAAYVAYRTPVLGVHTVAVSATAGEVSDEVRSEVVAAAGVATDTPLIAVDLQAVRQRVLGVPQVAAASVSRHWPHQLSITITARSAAAVTKANGALWLLDDTGVPYLELTSAAAPAGLLTIDLATPGAGDPATLAGLAVVGQLKAPIRDQVASVSAPSPYRVVLTLRDGRVVVWGSPDQGAKKLQILPALLAQPGHTYDISDPDIAQVK